MRGTNNITGKEIEGLEYLQQRLNDILTTPKGTRLMRRDYGCDLFELVDQSMDEGWLVQCYSAISDAVNDPVNGLPDFRLEKVAPTEFTDSNGVFDLTGTYLPISQRVTVSVGGTQ